MDARRGGWNNKTDLIKSNTSKMERDSVGLSRPFKMADVMAILAPISGDRVNDVRMLSILSLMACARSGRMSSVKRFSLRWMK